MFRKIVRIADELFPGFLDYKKSGLTPFSRASLWLMQERFSADEVHARKRPALVRKLREFTIRDPEGVAEKLKVLAEGSLPPPTPMLPALQRSLTEELALYKHLNGSIHGLDTDIAKQLARTPGAMLTTMPGISLRWAPGLYAEYGFLLMRRGENERAIKYYKKEKELWPEATVFMDSMIQTAQIADKAAQKKKGAAE